VVAGANESGEQQSMSGRTKHITVDLLPAVFISQVTLLMQTDNMHCQPTANILCSHLMSYDN